MTKNIIFTGFIALLTFAFGSNAFAALPPSVSTLPASAIGQTTITFNGYYNANGSTTSTWFSYGTSSTNLNLSTTPVIQGIGSGNFGEVVTGLNPATKYYFRAMAYNISGTATATSIQSATTSPLMGQSTSVDVLPVTSITSTSAQANAYYTLANNGTIWFQYGTSANNLAYSTTPVSKSAGNGSFSQNITSLIPNTTYYVKAYVATATTSISSVTTQSFKTLNITIPTSSFSLSALPATSILSTSAVLNGYVTITGVNTISLYFQYGTSVNSLNNSIPLADPATSNSPFSATLTSLTPNTTYYFKACGTNVAGASLCSTTTQSFKTLNIINPPVYACNDGLDNDLDNKTDMNDPGCTSIYDNDETDTYIPPTTYICNDGIDNDYDGYTDMNDIGCTSQYDNDETNTVVPPTTYACNDGYDNDYDGHVDMNDPGCSSSYDNDEYNYTQPTNYACSDGYDNDNDGRVDYPNDPGCYAYYDTDEYNYVAPYPNPYPNPYPQPQPEPKTIVIYRNLIDNLSGIDYLDLSIEARYPNAYTGDTVTYTVTYKNTTSRTTLKDLVLEVTLPKEIKFRDTEEGSYNNDGKVILKISSLAPGVKKSFEIEGEVENIAKYTKSITTKAKMTYKTISGTNGSETAYSSIDVSDYKGKSGLFSSFLPSTLLEWIILIIILTILILFARSLSKEKKIKTN